MRLAEDSKVDGSIGATLRLGAFVVLVRRTRDVEESHRAMELFAEAAPNLLRTAVVAMVREPLPNETSAERTAIVPHLVQQIPGLLDTLEALVASERALGAVLVAGNGVLTHEPIGRAMIVCLEQIAPESAFIVDVTNLLTKTPYSSTPESSMSTRRFTAGNRVRDHGDADSVASPNVYGLLKLVSPD